MNKAEIGKIMVYLFADHDVKITQDRLDVWFDQFGKMEFSKVMEAARILVSKKTFGVPKASDLHEALKDSHMAYAMAPELVWEFIRKAAQTYGRSNYKDAENLLQEAGEYAHQTIQDFWDRVCMCPLEEINFLRQQFIKTLEAVLKRNSQREMVGLPIGDKRSPVQRAIENTLFARDSERLKELNERAQNQSPQIAEPYNSGKLLT